MNASSGNTASFLLQYRYILLLLNHSDTQLTCLLRQHMNLLRWIRQLLPSRNQHGFSRMCSAIGEWDIEVAWAGDLQDGNGKKGAADGRSLGMGFWMEGYGFFSSLINHSSVPRFQCFCGIWTHPKQCWVFSAGGEKRGKVATHEYLHFSFQVAWGIVSKSNEVGVRHPNTYSGVVIIHFHSLRESMEKFIALSFHTSPKNLICNGKSFCAEAIITNIAWVETHGVFLRYL